MVVRAVGIAYVAVYCGGVEAIRMKSLITKCCGNGM